MSEKTENETTACFRVFGEGVDPAEVTALLGIEPSKAIVKGSERTGVSKKNKKLVYGIAREGGWIIESGLPRSVSLEEHLAALCDRLEPVAEKVGLLRERDSYRLDFYCGFFQWSGQCGPSFSPALLTRLARLGVRLGVDIFGTTCGHVDEEAK